MATGRAVVVGGRLTPAGQASVSIDDPAVRWGEGLFETMRAEDGRVPLLDRHLDRLLESWAALALGSAPARAELEASVAMAVAACPAMPLRVRLTATPAPTVLVEAEPLAEAPDALTAHAVRGAWLHGNRLAEHKTLSYGAFRHAARLARETGADVALLLDAGGRLGEADVGSLFVSVGGDLVTAPVDGLLAGVARGVVMEALGAREEALGEDLWRTADEIVMTNAVRGAVSIVGVDGVAVGAGAPGPQAARLAQMLRDALRRRRR